MEIRFLHFYIKNQKNNQKLAKNHQKWHSILTLVIRV
jgi:hypothetical protein